MKDNDLLMIILAFVFGFMLQGMMKNMCGGRLIEGVESTPRANKVDKFSLGLRPITCLIGINPNTGERTTKKYPYSWQMLQQGCESSISDCSDLGYPNTHNGQFYAPIIPGSKKLNLKPDLNQAKVCYGKQCNNTAIKDESVQCILYETVADTQDEEYWTKKNANNRYEEVKNPQHIN